MEEEKFNKIVNKICELPPKFCTRVNLDDLRCCRSLDGIFNYKSHIKTVCKYPISERLMVYFIHYTDCDYDSHYVATFVIDNIEVDSYSTEDDTLFFPIFYHMKKQLEELEKVLEEFIRS